MLLEYTEDELRGLEDSPSLAVSFICLVVTVAGLCAMKKFSDDRKERDGKQKESWWEWLTR